MMGTGSLISVAVYKLAVRKRIGIGHDFPGFIALKSPEICLYHVSGNPN